MADDVPERLWDRELAPSERRIADAIAKVPLKPGMVRVIEREAQSLAFHCGMAMFNELPRAKPSRGKNGAQAEVAKMASMVAELYRHVESMHSDAHALIDSVAPRAGFFYQRPALTLFSAELGEWYRSARVALATAPDTQPKSGASRKLGARMAAHQVVRKYEALTGRRATIATDPDTGRAYGPFLDLLTEVFAAMEISASAEAQGKAAIRDARNGKDPSATAPMVRITASSKE